MYEGKNIIFRGLKMDKNRKEGRQQIRTIDFTKTTAKVWSLH